MHENRREKTQKIEIDGNLLYQGHTLDLIDLEPLMPLDAYSDANKLAEIQLFFFIMIKEKSLLWILERVLSWTMLSAYSKNNVNQRSVSPDSSPKPGGCLVLLIKFY